MSLNNLGKQVLKIGVSVVLIALLLRQIDLKSLGASLAHARPWGIVLTCALFAFSIIPRAVRWKVLLDALDIVAPLRLLTRWYYIGAFFNTVLPTGFGGDVIKTVFLAQYSQQAPAAAGAVILDRFLGILVLLGMGAAALPFSRAQISPLLGWFIVLMFVGCVLGFWFLRRERWVRRLHRLALSLLPLRLRPRAERLGAALYPFYVALQGYNRSVLLRAILVSLFFNINWLLVNMAAGWALRLHVMLVDYLVFVPLVSLALLLPSFGGIGVRELSYVGLFTQVGVSREHAFAMSILVYAATILTGLLGGLLMLIQSVRDWRRPAPPEGA